MEENALKHMISQKISLRNYITLVKKYGETKCIPISMSENLLMVLTFDDFMPYGYEIIPLSQILSVEYSDSDAYFENIIKKEGAEDFIYTAPRIDIKDFITVFSFFKTSGEIIVVDIGKEDIVNVGKVNTIIKNQISMRCFSPTGIWDTDDFIEPVENITGVQFQNLYTKIFTKYLPPLRDSM